MTTKQVQWRRGTQTQHEAFTGAAGEVTVDTTNDAVRVHDGVTLGGHLAAKKSDIDATQRELKELEDRIADIAVSTGNGPYASISDGLAATSDGDVFTAYDGDRFVGYQNDNGVAVELSSYASLNDVDILRSEGIANKSAYDSLEDAIQAQVAAGRRLLRVDEEYTAVQTITDRAKLVFYGGGSFVGTNVDGPQYRRPVISDFAPTAHAAPESLKSTRAFRRVVKVVIAGDSLTTGGAEALDASDGLAEILERQLAHANPDLHIDFVSRGIGGQTYVDLDGIPTTSYPIANRYPWYTDDQRDWLDYVEDEAPDVVVLSSGMNDRQNLNEQAFASVVAKVLAMSSEPQIIFATNMNANLDADSDSFSGYAAQEGRDSVAGYVRSYAQYHDYDLLDINRTYNAVIDGRDILNTYLIEQEEVTYSAAQGFFAGLDQACRDYSIRAVFDAGVYNPANGISIKIGSDDNNVVVMNDNGGFIGLEFYGGGTSSLYRAVTTEIPTPSGEAEWEFSIRANTFGIRIIPSGSGADAGVYPESYKVIRHGGLFVPRILYLSEAGGPVLSATLSMGVESQFMPIATCPEFWGDGVGGGNGLNHPTPFGASIIYGTHFRSSDLKLLGEPLRGIGSYMWALHSGTGSIGFGNTVDGSTLFPSNGDGEVGSTAPADAGTVWECRGVVVNGATNRSTMWVRLK